MESTRQRCRMSTESTLPQSTHMLAILLERSLTTYNREPHTIGEPPEQTDRRVPSAFRSHRAVAQRRHTRRRTPIIAPTTPASQRHVGSGTAVIVPTFVND